MSNILFSVLIPTLESRKDMAEALWAKLAKQTEGVEDVELLMLRDNKQRTIGAKRQALLDIAQGEYLAFVDDDDDVSCDYVSEIVGSITSNLALGVFPELFVFPIKCTINGGQEGIVEPSIKYIPQDNGPLAEYKPPVTFRPPHQLCVWRSKIAKQARFPDKSKDEDFEWAAQCWPLVKNEIGIKRALYHWRHNIKLREHKETPA